MDNNSFHRSNTMKEGRSHANAAVNNTCRAVSDSSKVHTPNSPLSYFFSVTIAQPKIRIKIPKMLARTMQRRSGHDQRSDNLNKSKKTFGKNFGLGFCKVFGHKKSSTLETCSSNCENAKVYSYGNGASGSLTDGKKAKMLEKVEFDDMRLVESMIKRGKIDVNGDHGKQSRDVAETTLPMFKNILASEEEGGKKRFELDDRERRQRWQPCREYKQGQSSFKKIFKKTKNGFSFFGGNCKRSNNSSSSGVPGTDVVIGRKETSPHVPRVPSRIMTTRQRLKKARSIKKNLNEQIGCNRGREERVDEELCKKRILMGEKCRPLNHSGILLYDKDGILSPEILP